MPKTMRSLWVLGAALLLPYFYVWWLEDLRQNTIQFVIAFFAAFLLYALATVILLRHSERMPKRLARDTAYQGEFSNYALLVIFALAAAMMTILVFTRPTLSDDMYRYVWDGRVQAQGISPYRYPPKAPELAYLRDNAVWPSINRKPAVTVYPPAAEMSFALLWRIVPDSVRWFQVAIALAALLGGGLLVALLRAMDRSPARVLIYLWSPLLLFETAHGAHVDGLLLPVLIGAWWARVKERDWLVGLLLGVATALKLVPILLLPALWRPQHRTGRWSMPLAFAGTLLLCYLPYLWSDGADVLGFLPNYLRERFNLGLAALLSPLFVAVGLDPIRSMSLLLLATLAGLALYMVWRPAHTGEEALRRSLWIMAVFTLLNQNLFSWYLLWLLPLVAIFLQPGRLLGLRLDGWSAWWLFSGMVALSYTFFIRWQPIFWAQVVQFAPLHLFLILEFGFWIFLRSSFREGAVPSRKGKEPLQGKPSRKGVFRLPPISPSQQVWHRILLLCALITPCVYAGFVFLFDLRTLFDIPLLDLYKLSAEFPTARWWLMAGIAVLALLYWLGWRAAQQVTGRSAWLLVIGSALLSGLVLLWLYPIGAADIFDNIFHGRILGIYGQNPFQQVVNDFPADPFFYYTAWRKTPSAYGPIWEMMAGALAIVAGDNVLRAVIVFKLLNLLLLALAIGLVALILQRIAPQRALAGVLLLAWNPVVLYETIGNGHNDIAMILCVLAAIWVVSGKSPSLLHWVAAILLLVIGTLIKFIPVLIIPAVGLLALRRLPNGRTRTIFIVLSAVLSVGLIVLCYAPFWHGVQTLGLLRRQQLFTTSLASLLRSLLTASYGAEIAFTISRSAAVATLIFAMWQAIRTSRREVPSHHLAEAAFNIFIFYLLVACPWFETWYAVWPLALAALLPPGHAARLGALFGFVALSKRLFWEPLWLWALPLPPREWREVRLSLAVLLIPWLYIVFTYFAPRLATALNRFSESLFQPNPSER